MAHRNDETGEIFNRRFNLLMERPQIYNIDRCISPEHKPSKSMYQGKGWFTHTCPNCGLKTTVQRKAKK